MVRVLIVLLGVVVVGVLYYGMKHELAAPDPAQPPSYNSILWAIHDRDLPCNRVSGFRRLGTEQGWIYFFATCGDGNRYLYRQSAGERKVQVASCQEAALHGWYCPPE